METDIQKMIEKIPDYVLRVAGILSENGYQAFLVGGAVRDLLIGRVPKDYDIATDALPEQMEKLFERCITTNARFGTILVIMESETSERFDVEVTTFRKEEDYYGGRWPAKVEFTSDIINDLSRRDFTINAMALDLGKGKAASGKLCDPFRGQEDLKNGIIRAVRDPKERFQEDGLRAFKACRMASEFNFKLEDETFSAIQGSLDVARQISMERVRDEFVKCVKHSSKPSVGIELMRKAGLLEIFLPELISNIGVTQPEFHEDDVYTHSLKVMDQAEDSVKIPALLHDIGKAATITTGSDGKTHFYGHDQKGAEFAREVLRRMKFSNEKVERYVALIRWHMFFYPSPEWRKSNDIRDLTDIESVEDGGWSDAAIRRFIKKVGEDLIDDLFKLRIADAAANPKSTFDPREIEALQSRIAKVKAEDMALKIEDLAVNGDDLSEIGILPGPQMGRILNDLLNIVIEDPSLNKKEALIAEAQRMVAEK